MLYVTFMEWNLNRKLLLFRFLNGIQPRTTPMPNFPSKLILAKNWVYPQHINAHEGHMTLTDLRWLAHQTRKILKKTSLLTDSQVIYQMLVKGRSSAPSLRRTTHRVAAIRLSCAIRFLPICIRSEQNSAYGPSDCTKLIFVSVSPETTKKYPSALEAFIDYCVSHDHSLD